MNRTMAVSNPPFPDQRLERLYRYLPKQIPPTERRAAVMVLLAPGTSGLELLLTQRAANLTSHPNEIALPGGSVEPDDESLYATALRETREETGLQDTPRYVGQLDSLYAKSGIEVAAFVSVLSEQPRLQACADEVADMFWMPLDRLVEETPHYKMFERNGEEWPVPFFYFEGWTIWGMTGMILVNFINVLTESQWPSFHDRWAANPMDID